MFIIGICGPKRSGKDTLAKFIQALQPSQKIAFAEPLKEVVWRALNLPKLDYVNEERVKASQKIISYDGVEVFDRFLAEHSLPPLTIEEEKLLRGRGELGSVYRFFLQFFGTEVVRSRDPDFWVRKWKERVRKVTGLIITPDVRLENEAKAVKEFPSILIRLRRLALQSEDNHITERLVFDLPVDVEFAVEEGVENLERLAREVLYAYVHEKDQRKVRSRVRTGLERSQGRQD